MTGTDPTDPTEFPDPTGRGPLARPCVRVFELVRHEDVTGFSGVGVVADGMEFPDESVAFRWRGPYASTVVFEAGIDAVIAVHGHSGATEIRWVAVIPGNSNEVQADTRPPAGSSADSADSGWSGSAWDRHDEPHWPPPDPNLPPPFPAP